ncbi:hypothetical protein FACS1894201_05260 [Bacteroidia bacterium]|nr:hypothetical protein FACS1894201_05260 [Bacteroidia bacterium]
MSAKHHFRLRHLFDGSLITNVWVRKQIWLMLLIVFLAIIVIRNNYRTEHVLRETDKLKRELKELQTEYLSVRSDYIQRSQQSEIAKKLDSLMGIKESRVPTKTIYIPKDE